MGSPLDSGWKPQEENAVKQIIQVALLVAAAPALLSSQTVTVNCPEETCQVAPYFAGNGGFVGEPAGLDDESEVTFFVICGNVTISATVAPDGDGIVRQALTGALSCRAGARGRIEVDNLKPGGWYWINDDQNSAVSALIPKLAVGNEQIQPTDPGGVILDAERNGLGTYVKHEPTGRVGIIPHLVPTRAIPGCSGQVGEASAIDCHLGSPEGWRLEASPSSIVRPMGGQTGKDVIVTLYGENFLSTGTIYALAEVEYHHSVAGIQFTQATGERPARGDSGVLKWAVGVEEDDSRCLPANNDPDRESPQTLTFKIVEMEGVIPNLHEDGVETTITVNCPDGTAATLAAELVPENPFPVD